jgi:hypothetical protein
LSTSAISVLETMSKEGTRGSSFAVAAVCHGRDGEETVSRA